MSWVQNQQDTSLVADIKENIGIPEVSELPEVEEYTDPDFDSE